MQAFDITVKLGQRTILQGVDFTAEPGRVTAIAGPNGSGKTTLLRAMTGEIAHSGRVLLNGQDTRRMQPWHLAALRAVQPQSTTIAFPFTVLEIVRLGLSAGLSAADSDLTIRALRAVDLGGFSGRYYQDLSGGEQQRVQLARVLTQVWEPVVNGTPRWLILDEPVASLDPVAGQEVMDLFRQLTREEGITLLFTSHHVQQALAYSDRVLAIRQGEVVLDEKSSNLSVADLGRHYG